MTENEIATIVVNTAVRLHKFVGFGLLESAHDLQKQGLRVLTQQVVPIFCDGMQLEAGFRADLVIGALVIVELKSVETLNAAHKKQLLTYLKLANKKLGLLINFGPETFKGNVHRIVNGLENQV